MKVFDVVQNTDEWLQLRAGRPTASEFDQIITPSRGEPSKSADGYANRLLAELMVGKPIKTWQGNFDTDRGKEFEAEAASYYELLSDSSVDVIGFCTSDDFSYGASPDRLVGSDGLLEIKCPSASTHIEYLLNQKIDNKYYAQIQGQLLVTGRSWVDLISYVPAMPPVIMRYERDIDFLCKMENLLSEFREKMEIKKARLIELGHTFPEIVLPPHRVV